MESHVVLKHPEREWLIGNGLGSYSSGTISGILTRRYHGVFVAIAKSQLNRYLYVPKIEETIEINGISYLLGTNKWLNREDFFPDGYKYIKYFYLDENIPTWIYQCGDIFIEKKIFMPYEKNSTYVIYRNLTPHENISIKIKCDVFINNRSFHSLNSEINFQTFKNNNKFEFYSNSNEFLFFINSNMLDSHLENLIYYNYELEEEKNRGFPYVENHSLAVSLETNLNTNKSFHILISSDPEERETSIPIEEKNIKQKNKILLKNWDTKKYQTPSWIKQLIYSIPAFIIDRSRSTYPNAKGILAGYHWFGDWGRDTMISLSGLCLTTGQIEIAKSILENYARYIDCGMIPNRFPDEGHTPDYNTADASLWFIEAVFQYFNQTKDKEFLKRIYPQLESILHAHIEGTRYQIHCDPKDGLLYAGVEGSQLTWMDAKIDKFVVTPRIGKPIEINALWYNALKNMYEFSEILSISNKKWNDLAHITERGLLRFWNEDEGYCFDVLETPHNENDATLRPNQIIALSLRHCPFNLMQQRSMIDICGKYLVSFFGVKSLSKFSKQYRGHYFGSPFDRDCAYHQGTSWSWLLGNYAIAYYKVTKNARVAIGFLEPLQKHINEAGIGYISEIFDAESPYTPRGCIAQAWGVAETLRAWRFLSERIYD
ncbi:hypothetical protein AXG55_07170 [Silvanigrella aquatica]|uniref:Glycogen debranching protein n=1 Tax=Silvanigrella aquatica TaxID=1915309 RepID=A0A1L4D4M0_9BACT|nr:hypothetical protein AXG55_07170 [Silvanigrella aquatica]